MKMKPRCAAFALALVFTGISAALAQNYPSRPVTMVVPFAAGGPVDTIARIGGIYFQNATGPRFELVPYKGSGPAMLDLVGGRIELMIDQASNSIPQVRGGKIRAYAVTAKTRLAAAPDIPTVDEAGLPGLHVSVWYGIWAPRGTPRDVVAKLNGAIVAALAHTTVRARLAELGQ